jgi:hypothetical protein
MSPEPITSEPGLANVPPEPTTSELVEAVVAHPKRDQLIGWLRREISRAVPGRRALPFAPDAPDAVEPPPLEVGETAFGNLVTIMQRGADTEIEARLLGAALGVTACDDETKDHEIEPLLAELVWLSAHAQIDALRPLTELVVPSLVWAGLGRLAVAPSLVAPDLGFPEALVAAAALSRSTTEGAQTVRALAVRDATDSAVAALLGARSPGDKLTGELRPAPLGPIATTLLALTLLLFLWQLVWLILRYAFAFRRPAEVRISERGLELTHRTELLGRVLRDKATVVPLGDLSRVTREVRYARAGLYAGLVALVVGSYFGTGLFVDGLRVPGGSGSLLGAAVLLVVFGLALDFTLSIATDSARGRCRLVVVPRKGRRLCIGALDPARTDAMIASIAFPAQS